MKPRRLAIVLCFAIFVFEIVVNKYQLQVLNVTPQYFTLKLQGAVEAATKSTKKAWIPGINVRIVILYVIALRIIFKNLL